MKRKVFSSVLLSSLLFLGVNDSGGVDASTITQVKYNQGGAKYIYTNAPEVVYDNPNMRSNFDAGKYAYYTNERKLEANQEYSAEFFNRNYTGAKLKFGYAVHNEDRLPQTIRIKNSAVNAAYPVNPDGSWDIMGITSSTIVKYGNSSNDQAITIPAGGHVFILEKDVEDTFAVNGKIKFIPNTKLTLRQFVSKKKTDGQFPSPSEIFDSIKTPQVKNYSKNTSTANYNYDERYAVIDNATTSSFYVGSKTSKAYPQSRVGINEYEAPIWYLENSNPTLEGNYGIVYDFQFKNAAGKKIRIKPEIISENDKPSDPEKFPPLAFFSQVTYWTSGTWKSTTKLTKPDQYHYITIPADQHVKFILPSGNNGNNLFEIIE
ncbi:copper amine oxidase [Bacillus sp. TH30]|uniref:copper amine oxidase n=1 Tax=Bacillus sp. TH30 TaxID=2796395 RepID=UPI001912076B|nr:copper amine oxidase [Bacillus sp. TH30]MBK5424230.1 copper amine oxidase [Bacillus sp. TH30]